MTVHSPAWRRWQVPWRAVVPRTRLDLRLARAHVIVLTVSLYLVVLLLVYLHLAGQLAAVRYQTQSLYRRWDRLKVENAALEARVAEKLSVPVLMTWAEERGVTVSAIPMPVPRAPRVAAPARPAAASPVTSRAGNYAREWARAFHLLPRSQDGHR